MPTISEEYFASFNLHGPSVMQYSQLEYDEHLKDSRWTQHETTYLFALLQEYDLRFIVAADRYDYVPPGANTIGSKRSVEVRAGTSSSLYEHGLILLQDIKDRYYAICRRLIRTRTAPDPQVQQQLLQAFTFDRGTYRRFRMSHHDRQRDQAQTVRFGALSPHNGRDRRGGISVPRGQAY